jgi:hypothetical protein
MDTPLASSTEFSLMTERYEYVPPIEIQKSIMITPKSTQHICSRRICVCHSSRLSLGLTKLIEQHCDAKLEPAMSR